MTDWGKLPVLVVGAGPTGLTLGNLLGLYGVRTTLAEAKAAVNRNPRATFVDDEFFRLLDTIGLADRVRRQSLGPATYEHYSPLGFLLSREEGRITIHNYPTRSGIFQPWFDQTLFDGLARFPNVETLLDHEVVAVDQGSDAVEVTFRRAEGQSLKRLFRYVFAADGSRSFARQAVGIDFEAVTPLYARSLRIDVEGDPDTTLVMRSRPGFRRSAASFPAPNGRRYGFSVRPGEDEAALLADESIAKLLRPFCDVSEVRILHKAVYSFRTLVATRLRSGRVFLLGDAAHVQPPAGSQGMNSGARDANALAWRVAAVDRGIADAKLLDSYESDRLEAVRASVRRAGSTWRRGRRNPPAWLVVVCDIATKLRSVVHFRRQVAETLRLNDAHVATGIATVVNSGIVVGDSAQDASRVLGRALPNPWVEHRGSAEFLDSLLGREFALVGIDPGDVEVAGLSHPLWRELRASVVVLRKDPCTAPDQAVGAVVARIADDRLDRVLRHHRDRWLVVRPDRIVAAIAHGSQLDQVAGALGALLRARVLDRSLAA